MWARRHRGIIRAQRGSIVVQCPNCGGYRTYKLERGPRPAEPKGPSGCLYYIYVTYVLLVLSLLGLLFGLLVRAAVPLTAVLLVLSWVGLSFGLIVRAAVRKSLKEAKQDRRAWEAKVKEWETKGQDPWYQYGYHCKICGYQWLQRPGDKPSVRGAPDLRRIGEQLLREEEEAERRRQEEERRRREEEDMLLG